MSNTPYTLEYTAEQINRRLDLINENNNLLAYPYDSVARIDSIDDIGDGSFLTTSAYAGDGGYITLQGDFALSAGTYAISISVVDAIDTTTLVENPGFSLELRVDGELLVETDDKTYFTLDNDTAIAVLLYVPESFNANLLVKPQIERGTLATDWKPFMDNIGTYVDERFNGTNAKIRVLAQRLAAIESVLNEFSANGVLLFAEKEDAQ